MLDAGFGTLQVLKQRLLPQSQWYETTWDTQLAKLGLAVAGRLNAFCNRMFQRIEGRVDEFNAAQSAVVLRAFPVEVINSVSIRTFTGAVTEWVGGYQLDAGAGLMNFYSPLGDGTERIVVDYDGGYWLDDGGTMPAGATALPDDILEAWVAQCQAWAEARRILGEVAMRNEAPKGGSMTLDPEVVKILEPYRRYAGE